MHLTYLPPIYCFSESAWKPKSVMPNDRRIKGSRSQAGQNSQVPRRKTIYLGVHRGPEAVLDLDFDLADNSLPSGWVKSTLCGRSVDPNPMATPAPKAAIQAALRGTNPLRG